MSSFCDIRAMKPYDILLCGTIVLTMLLGSSFIPFIGIFLSMGVPQVFLYYGIKLGLTQGSFVAAGAMLLVSAAAMITGYTYLIVFCAEYAILGLLLSECFRREYPTDRTTFLGTVMVCTFSGIFMFSMSVLYNTSIGNLIKVYIDNQMAIVSAAYRDIGVSSIGDIDISRYIESFKAILVRLFPGIITVSVIAIVWMNTVIARPLLRLLKLQIPLSDDGVRLDLWCAPEWLVWSLITSGFGVFLGEGWALSLSLNAVLVISAVYFFNGMSIILFYFNKHNVSSVVRVIVYMLIAIQQLLMVLIVLAGIFDQWFDFRKLKKKIDIDG